MQIIIKKDYEEVSDEAAKVMLQTVKSNPQAVLGLATGSTPLGLYARMIDDCKRCGTSYAQIKAVNLDEYAGIDGNNVNSYAYFMRQNLFCGLDIDLNNTYIENGAATDGAAECERYSALLKELPRDIQLLGIGSNGHIAFNEPGTPFDSKTHLVNLTQSTIADNSRLFERIEDVPTQAYTMGLAEIMEAKKVLILATGANKAKAVYGLVKGEITQNLPASILQNHPDCILICDEAAAELIK